MDSYMFTGPTGLLENFNRYNVFFPSLSSLLHNLENFTKIQRSMHLNDSKIPGSRYRNVINGSPLVVLHIQNYLCWCFWLDFLKIRFWSFFSEKVTSKTQLKISFHLIYRGIYKSGTNFVYHENAWKSSTTDKSVCTECKSHWDLGESEHERVYIVTTYCRLKIARRVQVLRHRNIQLSPERNLLHVDKNTRHGKFNRKYRSNIHACIRIKKITQFKRKNIARKHFFRNPY